MKFFDPNAPVSITHTSLPHWSQAGTISFITWRTGDSIPRDVARKWIAERNSWLEKQGIDSSLDDWRVQLNQLNKEKTYFYFQNFTKRWNSELDRCKGRCVLRQRTISQIVSDSLIKFDGDRYNLLDFVIMPNHVHLLAAFPDEESMMKQCKSWKRFTAKKINEKLGSKGRFWQSDSFDHLVRSPFQLEALHQYITDNPVKAGLKEGEFRLMIRERRARRGPSHGV